MTTGTCFFRRLRGNNNSNNNRINNAGGAAPHSGIPARPARGRSAGRSAGTVAPSSSSSSAPNGGNNRGGRPNLAQPTLTCHTCRRPIARSERHIHTSRNISGERRYHRACFLCLHCGAPIDPQNQAFCYAKLDDPANDVDGRSPNNGDAGAGGRRDEEHPFHRECFARHFGWMCVVCEKPLPMVTRSHFGPEDGLANPPNGDNGAAGGAAAGAKRTKVEFLKHPFFDKERMCPHHVGPITEQIRRHVQQTGDTNGLPNGTVDDANDEVDRAGRSSMNTTTSEEVIGEIRRCAGCHRFEPLFASPDKHFIDVGDSDTGRCVCLACCRTVITTSDDVIPLWEKVIDFFEGPLGLITSEESLFPGLSDDAPYAGPCSRFRNKTGVTRQDLKNIPIVVVGMEALNDNMRQQSGGSGSGHYKSSQIMTRGLCLSESCGGDHGIAGVTAILCLSGLPADLTASILAHEATHAWIKLHPNFPYTDPLPLKVEEGLCQLVAHLFLNDGLDPVELREAATGATGTGYGDSNPSDEKLRQYFRFCIETDEGVYGEGFRLAARAYARMGMQELLYHVAVNHDFPPL